MEKDTDLKRVFFAFEVHSPWPKTLPQGRILGQAARHLTIAFLGDIHYPSLEKILDTFPSPKFLVGMSGKFDRCLFLPRERPNVVSWHIKWHDHDCDLGMYQREIADWLANNEIHIKLHKEGFLPHVTLSRRPFHLNDWSEAFQVLPLYIKDIHLYESKSHLNYTPLWTNPLLAPFEIDGVEEGLMLTIRGESLTALLNHCIGAIAFFHPSILAKYPDPISPQDFDELLPLVEEILRKAWEKDPKLPHQAQTLHGPMQEDSLFTWQVLIK